MYIVLLAGRRVAGGIRPLAPELSSLIKISKEKILYLCTGSQGEPLGAMMRIANYTHPDVFLEEGDTVIFSSKIIPGNERKLYKLHNPVSYTHLTLPTSDLV